MVVLRDGKVAGERAVSATTPEEVILLIVGREPSQVFRRPAPARAWRGSILEAVFTEGVGPVDCAIHSGEVVGLVGLRGAGQEDIGRALFGVVQITGGRVASRRRRQSLRIRRARPWLRASTSSAPTGSANSIVPNLSVRENLFLNPLRRRAQPVLAPRPGPRERAPRWSSAAQVGLSPNDPDAADRAALRRQPAEGRGRPLAASRRQGLRLRGSDRRRRRRRQGRDLPPASTSRCKAGAAIVIVSTDFEEVAKVCHRALVFDRGRVVAELAAADLSVENLLAAASASVGHVAASRRHQPPGSKRPCSPLSRTPSNRRARNSRACRAGGASAACCRSTACRS